MGMCFSVKSRASTTDVASNARLIDGRSLSTGLTNGGFGGLFWVFIGTVLCYSLIVASLAEMTSMAPTRSANSFVTVSLKRGLTTATTYLLTFTFWMKRILTR
jgi:amino acid permease